MFLHEDLGVKNCLLPFWKQCGAIIHKALLIGHNVIVKPVMLDFNTHDTVSHKNLFYQHISLTADGVVTVTSTVNCTFRSLTATLKTLRDIIVNFGIFNWYQRVSDIMRVKRRKPFHKCLFRPIMWTREDEKTSWGSFRVRIVQRVASKVYFSFLLESSLGYINPTGSGFPASFETYTVVNGDMIKSPYV